MFFNDWEGVFRTLVVGPLAYVGLVLELRMSGKRTLSKMNAFDLIVTVALGSTLATILLSKDVALVEGLTALGLLIALQYVITWASVRSDTVKKWVKADPTMLFYEGRFLGDVLHRERVTEVEVLAAVRNQGIPSMAQVGAVVLETDGSMTILQRRDEGDMDTLRGVQNRPRACGGLTLRAGLAGALRAGLAGALRAGLASALSAGAARALACAFAL
jgi:uncharacterized membrane protein YcaP (DUF421 family)